jgi:hypothetical protein
MDKSFYNTNFYDLNSEIYHNYYVDDFIAKQPYNEITGIITDYYYYYFYCGTAKCFLVNGLQILPRLIQILQLHIFILVIYDKLG